MFFDEPRNFLPGRYIFKEQKPASPHVIDEYSVCNDTIRCACGWLGATNDFQLVHKKIVGGARKH
jgi:hypothetical protein